MRRAAFDETVAAAHIRVLAIEKFTLRKAFRARNAEVRNGEFCRSNPEQRQSALGTGTPEADKGKLHRQWYNRGMSLMAAPGLAVLA